MRMQLTSLGSLMLVLTIAVCPACAQRRTSEDNAQLKRLLELYPAADANKDGVLTLEEARAYRDNNRPARQATTNAEGRTPAPTHADVAYGDHPLQRFDLWLAKSEKPTPLVLYIHGGGFRGGDKRGVNAVFLRQCLDAGYSFASLNYRMIPEITFPVPMHDCARAVQLLRHKSSDWNLDPRLIASTGGSAGGGISLWLAFHDDLADPESDDPIARESTRLTCGAVSGAQSSYDYRFTDKIGLAGFARHPSVTGVYGVDSVEKLKDPKIEKLMEEMAPINHVTADDPPVLMDYGVRNVPVDEKTDIGTIVHHPKLGLALQEKMKSLGLECIVQYPDAPESAGRVTPLEFIQRCFSNAKP